MVFEEEDHRGEALFSSHRIKSMCYRHDLLLLTLTLIAWFEVVFVRFLHRKVTPLLPCSSTICSLKTCQLVQPIVRKWMVFDFIEWTCSTLPHRPATCKRIPILILILTLMGRFCLVIVPQAPCTVFFFPFPSAVTVNFDFFSCCLHVAFKIKIKIEKFSQLSPCFHSI